jgi:antitoxin YefM
MAVTASEARQRLFPLIRQVNEDQEAVEITSQGGTAFLVPENTWRSMQEDAYLRRSPANAARLAEAIESLNRGQGIAREPIE